MQNFKKVEQYQFLEVLGKGANGLVYKGLNTCDGSLVAIKQMVIGSKKQSESIKMQVSLLKQFDHPFVVRYIDAIQKQNKIYIILEFMEGGSLASLVKKTPLDEAVIKLYVSKILRGLAYLHSQSVIHRDIKGANLLLTKQGLVKLADFGIAVKLKEEQKVISAAGSPYWMAPEVIKSEQQPTSKSDIWSLGCTIVELLTGNPPYHSLVQFAAMFRIVEDAHPPLPQCSQQCKQFLMRCFVKNPKERPTAQQLSQAEWLREETSFLKSKGNFEENKICKEIEGLLKLNNINYEKLLKAVQNPKDLALVSNVKFLERIAFDDRNSISNVPKIKFIMKIILANNKVLPLVLKMGILGNEFDRIRQKNQLNWQASDCLLELSQKLILRYEQTRSIACQITTAQDCSLQILILSKVVPTVGKLLLSSLKQKMYHRSLYCLKIITFGVESLMGCANEQALILSKRVLLTLEESAVLKQILALQLNCNTSEQSQIGQAKLHVTMQILSGLIELACYKPTIRKYLVSLVCELCKPGFRLERHLTTLKQLQCLSRLSEQNFFRAGMEKSGFIYHMSQLLIQIAQGLPHNENSRLLAVSSELMLRFLQNHSQGIDKNRVLQFQRHGGLAQLEIIFEYLRPRNQVKEVNEGLLDRISMLVAINQNYCPP